MKKCLSLIVVFALILTTLAMPMSASAYEAELLAVAAEAEAITLTYTASNAAGVISAENPVRPGESFTVDVTATAASDFTTNDAFVEIEYNTTNFTYVTGTVVAETGAEIVSEGLAGAVAYQYVGTSLAITTQGTKLATLTFSVNDGATIGESTIKTIADGDTGFYDKTEKTFWEITSGNIVDTPASVVVAANSAVAKIDNVVIPDEKTTYYGQSHELTVEGTNITSVKYVDPVAGEVDITEAKTATLTNEGDYTLTIEFKGAGSPKTYTFTLNTADIDAKLTTSIVGDDKTFVPGETFDVNVDISGLDGAIAAMVSFDVEYDDDLELTNVSIAEKVENQDSIIYGDRANSEGLTTTDEIPTATVATLTFTVKSQIAVYDDAIVTISNAQMALAKNINPEDDPVGITTASQTVTIVPDGDFAELTLPEENAWANENTIPVAPVSGADVVYIASNDILALETQEEIAAQYALGTPVTTGSFAANTEATYYVISKIGSVYEVTATLVNGKDIFVDKTNPTVTATDMTEWASTIGGYNYRTAITSDDVLSGIAKTEYKIEAAEVWTELPEDGIIAIADGVSKQGDYITIQVTDKAGNIATDVISVMFDGDAPEVGEIQLGTQAEGKIKLTVDIADNISGVTAKLYNGGDNGELSDIAAIEGLGEGEDVAIAEGVGTVDVTSSAFYYIVATDGAKNKAYAVVKVVFSEAVASALTVNVVDSETAAAGKFYTEDEMTEKGLVDEDGAIITSNGAFRYVKINVANAADGYKNIITLNGVVIESGYEVTELGVYTLVIRTEHTSFADDNAEAIYTFSIVEEEEMPSVDGNGRFNIVDHGIIRALISGSEEDIDPFETLTSEDEFFGGIYSGDVNGDFVYDTEDTGLILQSIRALTRPGNYTFPILNK